MKGGNNINLGDRIKKIRKENNLTQDDFAEKYNITRQTVSNWENVKSYPDIETLVRISDDFSISLEKLLKEDKIMVKRISDDQNNTKKYKKLIIVLILIISLIIVAIVSTFLSFKITKNKIQSSMEKTISNYGFVINSNDIYSYKYKDNIIYELNNPKKILRSGYNFNLYEKILYARIDLDNESLKFIWIDDNYFEVEIIDSNNIVIDEVGLLGYKKIDQVAAIKKKIEIDESILKDTIKMGNEIYNKTYK